MLRCWRERGGARISEEARDGRHEPNDDCDGRIETGVNKEDRETTPAVAHAQTGVRAGGIIDAGKQARNRRTEQASADTPEDRKRANRAAHGPSGDRHLRASG